MLLEKHRLICFVTSLIVGSFILIGCNKKNVEKTEIPKMNSNVVSQPINQIKYWEPLLFETTNNKLEKINLQSLKNKDIAEEDIEIRLWIGFGESPSSDAEGLILEKKEGNWTALYLPKDTKGKMAVQSKEPKSGWDVLWNNLNAHNFLTIADITESKGSIFTDATLIVIEIKDSKNYRNYMQVEDYKLEDYPELRSSESIELTAACRILSKEFNVPLCS
jgi:hypothetical protein